MTTLEQIAQKYLDAIGWTIEESLLLAMRECVEECANMANDMALYTGVDVAAAIRAWGEKP